ncbi:MAG: enoyl-CoA hydratase/carnithine racemase [Acidobacteria bacterium OLB17]|nr:MAG: enoyl-CoA hydratase/carnithine racemase [Acidobacteria bacterium OLB17]MCZ2389880.1 enoyl-CoA hydratase/isomerase family protein [Acidobacteriota bacterium]
MTTPAVTYGLRDEIATIEMVRPETLNALSLQLVKELTAAIRKAVADGARVAILKGRGRAFCSGGDLREMRSMWEREGRIEAFLEEPLRALHEMIASINEAPIPFIAAVNGVCAGAGTNLALACDIVIASEDAEFSEGFVKIGLSPDCGGTYFLPRIVGEKLAAELLMTGDAVTAERAEQIGLINYVVPPAELGQRAEEFARKLASRPMGALSRIKRMLRASGENDLRKQLDLEHECQLESGRSRDFREGVAAFAEKRKPLFLDRA